jgi:hypothetical protein
MMRKQSSEEIWDGFDSAPVKRQDDEKPKTPEAPVAVPEKPEAEENNAPALTRLDSRHIAEVFSQMAESARETQKPFRETLASLSGLIAKCHEAGMAQIGIEHAGFDTLRAYNFEKQRSKSGGQQVTFALLSIDDARFLIRVHPNNIIDCYASNINKPQTERQFLDDDTFWYDHRASGKASTQSEPKFFQYNLSEQQDSIAFLQTVIQTAAATGAAQELREYDLAAHSSKAVGKLPKTMKP